MRAINHDGGRYKMQQSIVRKAVDDESGFTLVEIIAVLVILGILAAVAVPKYFDLQSKAKDKALMGAIAEGAGRVTQYFGDQILEGVDKDVIAYTDANLGTDAGDFTLGFDANQTRIIITATGITPSLGGVTTTKTIPRPGAP